MPVAPLRAARRLRRDLVTLLLSITSNSQVGCTTTTGCCATADRTTEELLQLVQPRRLPRVLDVHRPKLPPVQVLQCLYPTRMATSSRMASDASWSCQGIADTTPHRRHSHSQESSQRLSRSSRQTPLCSTPYTSASGRRWCRCRCRCQVPVPGAGGWCWCPSMRTHVA